jgi:drug/metabolite transporter (DMT)-like permease
VAVWGGGYVFTKAGLQYAPPFTLLTLRFCFGLLCLVPVVLLWKPRWPARPAEWGHLAVAGLLMHAVQLGGSHYAQYLGMSAGVAALIIACQPLVTAIVVSGWMGERLVPRQWAGVIIGLTGVAAVVWHQVDIREVTTGSLAGTLIALAAVTAATLYQRSFSPKADLKAASVVQFAASLLVLVPLAFVVEGFTVRHSPSLWLSIGFLVVFASILAVNALHLLMRQGEATRVASMMYLPPVFAVVLEAALFGLVPSGLALAGIAVTCAGVAMTVWSRPRPALRTQ